MKLWPVNRMATPQGESLVCAQCYMERGPVVDLFTHGCFYPHQSSHLKAPRLAISTSHVPPSPQAASGVVYKERQVRPPPTNCLRVTRFHLCKFRPPITCRSGDLCTYAHSEEELKAWNRHAFVGKLPYPMFCRCVIVCRNGAMNNKGGD